MSRRPLHPIRVPLPAHGHSAMGIVRPGPPRQLDPAGLADAVGAGMVMWVTSVKEHMQQLNDAIAARTRMTTTEPGPGVMVVVDEAAELLPPRTTTPRTEPVDYMALMSRGQRFPNQRPRAHATLNELAAAAAGVAGPGPVAATPPTFPVGVRMVEPPTNWRPYTGERAIILCGLIPGVDPWHDRTAEMIAHRYADRVNAGEHPLTILCPRRRDVARQADGTATVDGQPWTVADQAAQVAWEARHVRLTRAVALFWFPESTPDYVGPTSLLELGAAWGQGMPVVVGAHPFYTRRDILEHQLPNMDLDLHATIPATVDAALDLLATHRATSIYRGRPGPRPRPSEIDPGSQPADRPTE